MTPNDLNRRWDRARTMVGVGLVWILMLWFLVGFDRILDRLSTDPWDYLLLTVFILAAMAFTGWIPAVLAVVALVFVRSIREARRVRVAAIATIALAVAGYLLLLTTG
ncbi:MAG: hypothetical protein ACK5H2_06170 [Beutenbergiaceae bacterium]